MGDQTSTWLVPKLLINQLAPGAHFLNQTIDIAYSVMVKTKHLFLEIWLVTEYGYVQEINKFIISFNSH